MFVDWRLAGERDAGFGSGFLAGDDRRARAAILKRLDAASAERLEREWLYLARPA
ncbi:MAG: hypothetical protein JHC60_17350, partial [Sphingobium sp.]|nr:hypothetical protein [Sphingobium sp.]